MRPFNFGQTLTDRHAEMERRDRVGVGVGGWKFSNQTFTQQKLLRLSHNAKILCSSLSIR